MADQARHDLCQPGKGVRAGGGDDFVGQGEIILVLGAFLRAVLGAGAVVDAVEIAANIDGRIRRRHAGLGLSHFCENGL